MLTKYLWCVEPMWDPSQNKWHVCRIEPVKQKTITSPAEIKRESFNQSYDHNISMDVEVTSWSQDLLVAIAIPLKSLINPITANFTASVRNIESGVDSRVRKT